MRPNSLLRRYYDIRRPGSKRRRTMPASMEVMDQRHVSPSLHQHLQYSSITRLPMASRMQTPRGRTTTGERLRLGQQSELSDLRMGRLLHSTGRVTRRPGATARSGLESAFERFNRSSTSNSAKKASVISVADDDIQDSDTDNGKVQTVDLTTPPLQKDPSRQAQRSAAKGHGSTFRRQPPRRTRLSVQPDRGDQLEAKRVVPSKAESRKRRGEALPHLPRPPKRQKEKENLDNNVLELSSSDDASPRPSRLKKKPPGRKRERGTSFKTIPAAAFSPQKEYRDHGVSGRAPQQKRSASEEQARRLPIRESERRKTVKSNFHPAPPGRQPEVRSKSRDIEGSKHLGNDDSKTSADTANRTVKETLRSKDMGFDDESALEVTSKSSTPTSKRSKKSVKKFPESHQEAETPRKTPPTPKQASRRAGGVKPIVITSSIPAYPKDPDDEVIIISDNDAEVERAAEDIADVLAVELSQKADISGKEEIPTEKFYGVPNGKARDGREGKRKGKRRSKQIVYESDDDEGQEKKDIRLRELSEEEQRLVRSLTFDTPKDMIISKIKEARIDLRAEDFGCLRASRWLSDEIMNSFVALINARNKEYFSRLAVQSREDKAPKLATDSAAVEIVHARVAGSSKAENSSESISLFRLPRPRSHVFNTFFFARLTQKGYDYEGVKRWLKKAGRDVLELDLIMFPINISNLHWVLAAIDLRRKRFLYFDSTFGRDSLTALPKLGRWLQDEVKDKHGEETALRMNILSWESEVNPKYQPSQKDGGSCGVFALYMAEYLERGQHPNFEQGDIRVLRQRTALFLRQGALPKT